jgi:hypothetical protein
MNDARGPGKLARIAVGLVVTFLFMSLLYGPNQVLQLLFLAVVCTFGFGLIPLLFLFWIVGWITLAVWGAISRREKVSSPS